MRWEDQELNHEVPENKFPEVMYAGLFLMAFAARQQGLFLKIDQGTLEQMIEKGHLPVKAKGARIDRLCLYYRLACRLGPGGERYPVLGTTHFWSGAQSLYAILFISFENAWLHIMVLRGEAPNKVTGANAGGPHPLWIRTLRTSRIAQFRRWVKERPAGGSTKLQAVIWVAP